MDSHLEYSFVDNDEMSKEFENSEIIAGTNTATDTGTGLDSDSDSEADSEEIHSGNKNVSKKRITDDLESDKNNSSDSSEDIVVSSRKRKKLNSNKTTEELADVVIDVDNTSTINNNDTDDEDEDEDIMIIEPVRERIRTNQNTNIAYSTDNSITVPDITEQNGDVEVVVEFVDADLANINETTDIDIDNDNNINPVDTLSDSSSDIIIVQKPTTKAKPATDTKTKTKTKSQTNTTLETSSKPEPKKMKDVQCPVCMESITEAVATPCGHVFCSECIYQALAASKTGSGRGLNNKKSGRCPICRNIVVYSKLRWLNLRFIQSSTPT